MSSLYFKLYPLKPRTQAEKEDYAIILRKLLALKEVCESNPVHRSSYTLVQDAVSAEYSKRGVFTIKTNRIHHDKFKEGRFHSAEEAAVFVWRFGLRTTNVAGDKCDDPRQWVHGDTCGDWFPIAEQLRAEGRI